MAPAVVVHDHDGQVRPGLLRAQHEAVRVVQERQVAQQRERRAPAVRLVRQRRADRGADHAVDARDPPVGEHPGARADADQGEVAHRLRRPGDEQPVGRDGSDQRAGHPGLGHPVRGVEHPADRLRRPGPGLTPLQLPARLRVRRRAGSGDLREHAARPVPRVGPGAEVGHHVVGDGGEQPPHRPAQGRPADHQHAVGAGVVGEPRAEQGVAAGDHARRRRRRGAARTARPAPASRGARASAQAAAGVPAVTEDDQRARGQVVDRRGGRSGGHALHPGGAVGPAVEGLHPVVAAVGDERLAQRHVELRRTVAAPAPGTPWPASTPPGPGGARAPRGPPRARRRRRSPAGGWSGSPRSRAAPAAGRR